MGGRSGGWDHRDHDAFIKVWTQVGCTPIITYPVSQVQGQVHNNSSSSGSSNGNGSSSSGKYMGGEEKVAGEEKDNASDYKRNDDDDENDDYHNDNNDDAEKESYDIDTSRGDDADNQAPPSYRSDSKDVTDIQESKGPGSMALPRGQVSSLLRRLPVAVPGKLQEEFEEHIAW